VRRRRSGRQVVKDKLGDETGATGAMKYMAPSGGRYLVKNGDDKTDGDKLEEALLRQLIAEIVKSCDDGKYCLYTKKKDPKTGKRRRLGTHGTKADAYRQERAIKSSGG
jgi:hypothetical protein